MKELGSTANGLSQEEAAKRLERYGKNSLDEEEEDSLWEKIKEQFEDTLARILLLAASISFIIAITGDGEEGIAAYVEPFVILLILILNAIVAIYQDADAESALQALKDMQATMCEVKRGGEWTQCDAVDLVPGDIVRIEAGKGVPADIRLIELNTVSLQIGEASLTGESEPVNKVIEEMKSGGEVLQD